MVKIIRAKNIFIKNNDKLVSKIIYDHTCSSTIFSENIKLKKTKISSMFFGSCVIDDVTYFFKTKVNFIIINNKKDTFFSNVSIYQVNITDDKYETLPDISDDDFAENIIYDIIENMFILSKYSKNIENNKYLINFNIPFNNENVKINNLSCSCLIGVFSDNL